LFAGVATGEGSAIHCKVGITPQTGVFLTLAHAASQPFQRRKSRTDSMGIACHRVYDGRMTIKVILIA